MQKRQHHAEQGGLLTAVQARCAGKNGRRPANQRTRDPEVAGRVDEVFQRRRHVAEAGGRTQRESGGMFEIRARGIRRPFRRHRRQDFCGLRRDGRHCAQTCLHALDALDAVGNAFRQRPGVTPTRVE